MPRIGNRSSYSQTGVLQAMSSGWQACVLTWYDPALGGTNSGTGVPDPHAATASGEPYDASKYTCAAPPAYAFGTVLTFRYNGKEVACRVNDRGGAIQGSHFDLSRAAANALGILGAGRVAGSFQVGKVPGAPDAANAQAQSNQTPAPSDSGPKSILDLLTSPTDQIGGWLARIALNLVKDAAIGFADVIIIPAWHWNQRAVDRYQTAMFSDKSGKQLLWTAAFWGGGYWLLFTDPDQKGLTPGPARRSRLARHTRLAQSLPARQSLVKPKDVKKKTPKKPKPVESRAEVTQTGTMSTTRAQRVKVHGTHANESQASDIPVSPENRRETEQFRRNLPPNDPRRSGPPAIPNERDRTGTRSLPNSRRNSQRNSRPRERGGR